MPMGRSLNLHNLMQTVSKVTLYKLGEKSLDLSKVGPNLRKLLTKKVTIQATSLYDSTTPAR